MSANDLMAFAFKGPGNSIDIILAEADNAISRLHIVQGPKSFGFNFQLSEALVFSNLQEEKYEFHYSCNEFSVKESVAKHHTVMGGNRAS